MIYYLKREARDKEEIIIEEFKGLVFANNPELYQRLFPPESNESLRDDEVQAAEFEWIVPESEADVEKLIREFESQMQ